MNVATESGWGGDSMSTGRRRRYQPLSPPPETARAPCNAYLGPPQQTPEQRSVCSRKPRQDFEHHVVLVQLSEDGRHMPLPEVVVERVVDGLRENPQARRGVAVNRDICPQPVVELIRGHIAQLRQSSQFVDQLRRPL